MHEHLNIKSDTAAMLRKLRVANLLFQSCDSFKRKRQDDEWVESR
jgi:hypothetical protein